MAISPKNSPLALRHNLAMPSLPTVTTSSPVGLNAPPHTAWVCPFNSRAAHVPSLQADKSQSRAVVSSLVVKSVFPSGLKATVQIGAVCPFKTYTCLPFAASQIMAVWSPEPVAKNFPSGLVATESTLSVCPRSVPRTRDSVTAWRKMSSVSTDCVVLYACIAKSKLTSGSTVSCESDAFVIFETRSCCCACSFAVLASSAFLFASVRACSVSLNDAPS